MATKPKSAPADGKAGSTGSGATGSGKVKAEPSSKNTAANAAAATEAVPSDAGADGSDTAVKAEGSAKRKAAAPPPAVADETKADVKPKTEAGDTSSSQPSATQGSSQVPQGVVFAGEFEKPGQKFVQPSPGNGDRVFYETLFRQKPNSGMALIWCIEHGVLPLEEATRMYSKYLKAKGKQPADAEDEPAPSSRKASSSAAPKPKKARVHDPTMVGDGDVGMSAGGTEYIGATTM